MEAAGLENLLKQQGSYTVFAPTDDAFDGLSEEDLALLKGKNSFNIQPCSFEDCLVCSSKLFDQRYSPLFLIWMIFVIGRWWERFEKYSSLPLQRWHLHQWRIRATSDQSAEIPARQQPAS